jgi:hypothetical protein
MVTVTKKFSLGYVHTNHVCPQTEIIKYLQVLDDSIINQIVSKYGLKIVSSTSSIDNFIIYSKSSKDRLSYIANQNNNSFRVVEIVYTTKLKNLVDIFESFDKILTEINFLSRKVFDTNYANIIINCESKLYKFYSYVEPDFINFDPVIYKKYSNSRNYLFLLIPYIGIYLFSLIIKFIYLNMNYFLKVINFK